MQQRFYFYAFVLTLVLGTLVNHGVGLPGQPQKAAAAGEQLVLWQRNWTGTNTTEPIAIESLAKRNWCQPNPFEPAESVKIGAGLVKLENVNTPSSGVLVGKRNSDLDSSFVISNVYTSNQAKARWDRFAYTYHNFPNRALIKAYYRISDTGGTDDPADPNWILLPTPTTDDRAGCLTRLDDPTYLAAYNISRVAKYFQFKIHIVSPENADKPFQAVDWIRIRFTPGGTVTNPTPSPAESASPNPSSEPSSNPSVSPSTKTGRLTIEAKKINQTSPSPTPVGVGPPLPKTSPSPSPSVVPGQPNPLCFDDLDTDPASGVPLKLQQTEGGELFIDDATTNNAGRWRGRDDKTEEFPVGTYVLTPGEWQPQDYSLVAICVAPNNGQNQLRTQSSIDDRKLTLLIREGFETKITLLYGPRNKPFITMNKYAIDTDRFTPALPAKILKTVYPGQQFFYLIKYENTGGELAKNITIADVIPDPFKIPEEFIQDPEKLDFGFRPDPENRTLIAKDINQLGPKEKGSLIVPVEVPANYGSPVDTVNQ